VDQNFYLVTASLVVSCLRVTQVATGRAILKAA